MDDDEGPSERVKLSLTQVLAGAVAAMVGSLVASRLGIAGTIIGTAVFSVVATVLTAINVNSMVHVRERARAVRLASAQAQLDRPAADRSAALAEIAEIEAEGAEEAADTQEHGRFIVADRRGYHWGVIAGVSALVFLLAMVGITVVESITGKAISCSLWQECDDPTTIPLPGRPGPSKTPSPSPSDSPSPSATETVSQTPSPTPTPSPAPSDSGTPSPSPSVSESPLAPVASPS